MVKVISREEIINKLSEELKNEPFVYAFWLEGADGVNAVDEYSDIDIVVDVEDGKEESVFNRVEEILNSIDKLDLNMKKGDFHPKLQQKYYHLINTNKYLIIDFCIQSHSRDAIETSFVKGDMIEVPKIIFDKCKVVTFRDKDTSNLKETFLKRIEELEGVYKQLSRVEKYVKRNQFLEASIYYHKYVLDPIVELFRMIYTPNNTELWLIHISNHLPKDKIDLLERLYKVTTVEEILDKTFEAEKIFRSLVSEIKQLNL